MDQTDRDIAVGDVLLWCGPELALPRRGAHQPPPLLVLGDAVKVLNIDPGVRNAVWCETIEPGQFTGWCERKWLKSAEAYFGPNG